MRKMAAIPHSNGKVRADWWTEEFDAVVVATGENDAAWIPDIPGVDVAARAFPERLIHSREYRTPSPFEGKVSSPDDD